MQLVEKPAEIKTLSERWRAEDNRIGFVPTLGALHEVHLSLIRAARSQCKRLVVSIFVNPTQFRRGEDFDTYARPFERDSELLREAGCDALFAPNVEAMYGGRTLDLAPSGERVHVEPGRLGEIWEGESRPGHMRGVATVVAMLFNIARPHRAYFGEKDYQQLKVVERLARNLFFGVEVISCPTVRESDGLALSSRNVNLTPEEREAAPAIYRALRAAADLARGGERDAARLVDAMLRVFEEQPLVDIQYAAIVDAETLASLDTLDGPPA
ncbi:MAG: pantoate--beta-alanine ligase, partial [Rubrobacteraceae bacterium]